MTVITIQNKLLCVFSARMVPHTGSHVDGKQLHLHGGNDPADLGPRRGNSKCQGMLSVTML